MKGGDKRSKSIKAHKAAGTFRANRHGNRIESSAKLVNDIPAPNYFQGEHLRKWNEVVGHLRDFGILAIQDADSIETYVSSIIVQKMAYASIISDGLEVDGFPNPNLKVYQQMEAIIKPLREQFGFTPRARQGIHVKKETKSVDPILEILTPKRKAV
jgi:P27 family predicted phage terminase small subunit